MVRSIAIMIAKGFSVRVQADATREGQDIIVMNTKQNDLAVTFGLAYKAEWSRTPPAPPAAPPSAAP